MKQENIKSEYQRKVDKSLIPTCNIMGVNIAAINMNWLLKYIDENLSDIKGDYICVSNVHTTVTSYEDAAYCAVQNGGLMAIPDGGPLSSVGRKRGYSDMDRTTGPSLMGEIFKISAEKGYRHYFYGSTEETLKLLKEKLQANYPGIQIAGMYSPPFRPLTEEEDKNIIENIKMKDAIRQRAFDRFLENFLKDKVSAPYIGFEALKAGSKNYDVVVAGGDQLWIPAGLPTNFFNLMFADEKVKRVSYSTSFGVTEVPFYQKRRTIEYLNILLQKRLRDLQIMLLKILLRKKERLQSVLIPVSNPMYLLK